MGIASVRVIPWSAMKPDIKALRVDGQHPTRIYPYRQTWSLSAAPGYRLAEPRPEIGSGSDGSIQLPSTIRLAAVGDINFDRSPAYIMQTTGDLPIPLSLVKPIFDRG